MTDEIKKIIAFGKDYQGLTTQDFENAKAKHGLNVRPAVKGKSQWKRALDIATEPMILLLLIASVVYFIIGDKVEASILLFSIIPVVIMEFIQQQRTDQAISALDKIMVEFCQVYRNGEVKQIEIKYLVPGDLVYLTSGDKVPADGVLLRSSGLMADESILTGESVGANKSEINDVNKTDEENKLYQGTLIIQGDGKMLITETGIHTAYGKLGTLLQKIEQIDTPLQQKIRRLVRNLAIAALLISLFVGVLMTIKFNFVQGLLSAITMTMSLIPEEFPIVFSVFLIMGVWRMTKQNALTREMAMVETLGSASIICTDKTGTLTQGKMALEKIFFNDKIIEVKDLKTNGNEFNELISTSLLSLEQVAIDPMELEVQNFATKLGINVKNFYEEHTLIDNSPFESQNKLVHHVWKNSKNIITQFSAGAPESIINNSNLKGEEKKLVEDAYRELAGQGYRVIAIAHKPSGQDEKISINNLNFFGLLAMSDPIRPGVKEAISICQTAGIRVMMITGDNKLTAHNIAEHIGMKHNDNVINGSDLENISEEALTEIVKTHDIFSRVKPEQKYAIVNALQNLGEIVAMTGDGVNDAPALKKANIGIAMGQKGTEVARAAAGIVLLDDNFTTIVHAVKEGRRIYDNLRQAFAFLFAFHLPIVGLAVFPLFLGHPLVFLPIHIIFLELVCDPATVIGFEREKARKNLMSDKPRSIKESLINSKILLRVIVQGLSILAVSFGFYYYFAIHKNQIDLGRTFAFASLVLSQVFIITTSREWNQVKNNSMLLIISFITLAVLALIIALPATRDVFHLATIDLNQILLLVSIPLLVTFAVGNIFKK